MSTTATAKRRRKQARQGYTHIAKRKRPRYCKSAGGGPGTSFEKKKNKK